MKLFLVFFGGVFNKNEIIAYNSIMFLCHLTIYHEYPAWYYTYIEFIHWMFNIPQYRWSIDPQSSGVWTGAKGA